MAARQPKNRRPGRKEMTMSESNPTVARLAGGSRVPAAQSSEAAPAATGPTLAVSSRGRFFANPTFHFETLRNAGYVASNCADLGEILETVKVIAEGDVESWYAAWEATADRVLALAEAGFAQQGRGLHARLHLQSFGRVPAAARRSPACRIVREDRRPFLQGPGYAWRPLRAHCHTLRRREAASIVFPRTPRCRDETITHVWRRLRLAFGGILSKFPRGRAPARLLRVDVRRARPGPGAAQVRPHLHAGMGEAGQGRARRISPCARRAFEDRPHRYEHGRLFRPPRRCLRRTHRRRRGLRHLLRFR